MLNCNRSTNNLSKVCKTFMRDQLCITTSLFFKAFFKTKRKVDDQKEYLAIKLKEELKT